MRGRATHRVAVGLLAATAALVSVILAVPPTSSAAGRAFDRVVTLGDSYSSGMGIHRDGADYDDHGPPLHSFRAATRLGGSACHRELDTTPGPLLAEALGARSDMVACAGAVVDDLPRQLAAAAVADTGRGTLAVLTIGGNDVRTRDDGAWPDVLVRCITSAGCHERAGNQLSHLSVLQSALVRTYVDLGTRHPDLVVRVLAYPRLMQRERWGCPGVTGVSRAEADWIDDQVDRVNGVLAAAVSAAQRVTGADLEFVPVVDEFDNHGACRFWQRDRYVNDAVFGATLARRLGDDGTVTDERDDGLVTLSGSSFHPSAKGYEAYHRALVASLDELVTPRR